MIEPGRVLKCGDRELALGTRTFIMGIVNVTPDSFSDGGSLADVEAAVAHALALIDAGADVVDVGGESTAPGRAPVPVDVEEARVLPVIERLASRGVRCISVDTKNASTARAALDAGAAWVNDVSALAHDDAMAAVASRADAVVVMHSRPFSPADLARGADDVDYGGDVVGVVHAFLAERVAFAVAHGIERARIVVDAGIGFGKSVDDNVRLLSSSARFHDLTGAVLAGPSRKRFLGVLARVDVAGERDAATHGAVAAAIEGGAHIVRVHDVKGAVHCARVIDAVVRQR